MEENKFWITIWGMIASSIVIIAVLCTLIVSNKQVKMAELGYQQESMVGSNASVWVKVK